MMNSVIVKLLGVLIAWAVVVQVFVPNTNVAGYDDIATNVNSDPFVGLPSAPVFPDFLTSPNAANCTSGWDIVCQLNNIAKSVWNAITWIGNIFIWIGEGTLFLVEALVDGIVWIGGVFVGIVALTFGAATFQLEDDGGNPIVMDSNVQLLLYGISAFVWLLVGIWIIATIRGNG